MSELRLIVFDVDGTLVDSEAHILAAAKHGFQGLGLPVPPREEVLNIVGLSLPEAIAKLTPDQDVATQAALVDGYKSGYMALRSAETEELSPLFPGAMTALDTLQTQPMTLLGIATGNSRRGLTHLLDRRDLNGHFVTLQVADDHPSKPHPSMLMQSLADTGATAQNSFMVGDTEYDMEMAKAAGFQAIGVSWGHHSVQRLVRSGADVIVDDFTELMQVIAHKGGVH